MGNNELKFITADRPSFIKLVQDLIDGIPTRFFHQKENRLNVLVNGVWNSGKSLVTDAAYAKMFSENKQDCGAKMTYETNVVKIKPYKGLDIIITFSNWEYEETMTELDNLPSDYYGGIEFFQNFTEHGLENDLSKKADIVLDIGYVEFVSSYLRRNPELNMRGIEKHENAVQDAYIKLAEGRLDNELRILTMKVNNQELGSSEKFQKCWNALAKKGRAVKNEKGDVLARVLKTPRPKGAVPE